MKQYPLTSFLNRLSEQKHGFEWHKTQGFQPHPTVIESEARIVVISQLISESVLFQLCEQLSAFIHIEAITINQQTLEGSSVALNIHCLPVESIDKHILNSHLRALSKEYLIDLVFVSTSVSLSSPGLLVMDMDSTMIQMECIDEIARLAGRYDEVAKVTAQAMNGKMAFADSLATRVACLSGVEVSSLNAIKKRLPLMPGLWALVSRLQQSNWRIAIASGGFTYFADYLKDWMGLDFAISNTLEIANDQLTGKTLGTVVDGKVKAQTLVQLREQWGIAKSQTVAIGDGANDLPMLSEAGMGVAFHAKPSVQANAEYSIQYQPLDALLTLLTD